MIIYGHGQIYGRSDGPCSVGPDTLSAPVVGAYMTLPSYQEMKEMKPAFRVEGVLDAFSSWRKRPMASWGWTGLGVGASLNLFGRELEGFGGIWMELDRDEMGEMRVGMWMRLRKW